MRPALLDVLMVQLVSRSRSLLGRERNDGCIHVARIRVYL